MTHDAERYFKIMADFLFVSSYNYPLILFFMNTESFFPATYSNIRLLNILEVKKPRSIDIKYSSSFCQHVRQCWLRVERKRGVHARTSTIGLSRKNVSKPPRCSPQETKSRKPRPHCLTFFNATEPHFRECGGGNTL